MMKQFSVQKSVVIQAPANRVWSALIDPASIKKYLFGTEAISDWQVGSRLEFHGSWEGNTYLDQGTILQMDPEKLFQYDYHSSVSGLPNVPENYQLITFRLFPKGSETELQVSQERLPAEANAQHAEAMWGDVLQKLKGVVEEGAR